MQLNRLWLFSESVNCNFPAYMYSTSSRYIRARRTIRFFSLGDSEFFHATRGRHHCRRGCFRRPSLLGLGAKTPQPIFAFASPSSKKQEKRRGDRVCPICTPSKAPFLPMLSTPFYLFSFHFLPLFRRNCHFFWAP